MLLAEDRLDSLVERLRAMSPVDRAAILSRLDRAEHARVAKLLEANGGVEPWSADIVDRIADPGGLPDATRKALARAVAAYRPRQSRALAVSPKPSLIDAARHWLAGPR